MTAQELLTSRLDYLVLRSARGNEMVRRDPRELPRRIRVLLLAIDGSQTVEVYVSTLRGFGDVAVLLSELLAFGLIELRPRADFHIPPPRERTAFESSRFESSFQHSTHEEPPSSFESSLFDSSFLDTDGKGQATDPRTADHWRKPSREMQDVLYGSTAAGSFDEMLRVARATSPNFRAPPPPAPISPEQQKAQVQSVFTLLDAVRGERKQLRSQVSKLQKFRAVALRLHKENQRLADHRFALGVLCSALAVMLVLTLWMLAKR